MRLQSVGLALILMFAIGACGESGDSTIQGTNVVVNMFDNKYEYNEIHVPVGGTVNFVGAGRNPHNAKAANGSWSTEAVFGSLDQFEGDSAQLTYDEPGEYPFFCTYHGNDESEGMAGLLVVGEPSS